MITLDDFISSEIIPTLDNPDEYDVDAIAREVGTLNPIVGYVWDKAYIDNPDGYRDVVSENMRYGLCAHWLLDHNGTEELYNAHFVDYDGFGWDISVLVSDDGEPYTTSNWQGTQPERIDDCADYDWVRCADWHLIVSNTLTLNVCQDIIRELGR